MNNGPTPKQIAILVAIGLPILAALGWVATKMIGEDDPVYARPKYVVVLDQSEHMQAKPGDVCKAIGLIVPPFFNHPTRNKLAELLVYLSGDETQAGPQLLGRLPYSDIIAAGGIHGNKERSALAATAREDFLETITTACKTQAKRTEPGAIYDALWSVTADLAKKCAPHDHCQLVAFTDLHESREPWICTEVLGQKQYGKRKACPVRDDRTAPTTVRDEAGNKILEWSAESIPPPLNTENVKMTACGLSQSRGGSSVLLGPRVADQRQKTWEGLFPGSDFTILNACELL